MKRIPLPLLPLLLLPLCLASTGAMETLRLDFSKERSAVVGGVVHAPEPEMLRNGELAVGARGFSLPAAPLLGENEGTILFRVRFEEPREPRNTMRSLVTLRTNSRLYAGYYFFGDRRWAFVFSDQDKTFRMEMPDPLEPGKDYRLGFSWDGETLKLFRDGRLLAQTEQPLPVENPTRLHLGPYKDPWIATNPWCDDTFIQELRFFSHALSPGEVAELSGVSFPPLPETHPPRPCPGEPPPLPWTANSTTRPGNTPPVRGASSRETIPGNPGACPPMASGSSTTRKTSTWASTLTSPPTSPLWKGSSEPPPRNPRSGEANPPRSTWRPTPSTASP